MTCPACGEALASARERCSFCGAVVSPPVQGALAPEPSTVTPAAPGKTEPLREIPGLRKREKTWKDEVSERVRHRRRRRAGLPELPLFDREQEGGEEPRAATADPEAGAELARELPEPPPRAEERGDLPLRAPEVDPLGGEGEPLARVELGEPLEETERPARGRQDWPLEVPSPPPEIKPVERPALFLERLRAGAIDMLFVAALWTVVVYFASRAAHVPVLGLRPNWPSLAAYLAFLGLAYAAYFTGTTGQTLGKMVTGLRVLDRAGQPPGYARAFLRAALGALGVATAGLGLLPLAFDPARRALHDRLLRTRVVRG